MSAIWCLNLSVHAKARRSRRAVPTFSRACVTMSAQGSPTHLEGKKVVICGGGVIGTSIAYYLALKGVASIIVDRAELAAAASGKAGGFLALDWNDGSPVGPLARKSFELHSELAETLGLESYRRLSCQAVAVEESNKPASRKLQNVEWADLGVRGTRVMGNEDTIAQVHPKRLTEALFTAAAKHGTTKRTGVVEGVEVDSEGRVTAVRVDGDAMPADVVVVAMGPWSAQAATGLPIPPVYGQKYHSVLMRPERVLSQAVFFQGRGDPEVYPRPDGDVYVTGFPDPPVMVEEIPGEVEVRQDVCDRLVDTIRMVSSEMSTAEVTLSQACHLPITTDGIPMMGLIPTVEGAYIATGHSCWGILNSPATGLAMAELIVEGAATSVDISSFDPLRFFKQ